jgi:hypothetical protein
MADLTYEDYKQRVSIQEVLQDAGYHLNRRDGLRYPSYVRLDNDGRRVHGDKFIVTANGMCCFQPPERKNYNIISFIKEHPTYFADYTPGMSKDRLVNLVCCRLLHQPLAAREEKILKPQQQTLFNIADYNCRRFVHDDRESQKAFYPYFKARGLTPDTQKAFCGHFFLATSNKSDGRHFTNLSFPLTLPAMPGKHVLGLEERSRPNAEGKTLYKGMAAGSNATEGVWLGRLQNHRSDLGLPETLHEAHDVLWFESAYDAMAYYQIAKSTSGREAAMPRDRLGNAVFASTGGHPSETQIRRVLEQTPSATQHLCFDNDRAGQSFTETFKAIHQEMGLDAAHLRVEIPAAGYKDWNDQVMGKLMPEATEKIESDSVEKTEEQERPHFRR